MTWLHIAAAWVGMLLVSVGLLWLPPLPERFLLPRCLQGWMIPHTVRRSDCRIACATCRSDSGGQNPA